MERLPNWISDTKKKTRPVRTSFVGKALEEAPPEPKSLRFWARYHRWKLLVISNKRKVTRLGGIRDVFPAQ
jgi:hypothetical protein